jgi:urea-proton symporter
MLIRGGVSILSALCGMHVYAASFLIPISAVPLAMHGTSFTTCCLLTGSNRRVANCGFTTLPARPCAGGNANSTRFWAWAHVAILYVAMLLLHWRAYVGPSGLGSTDRAWENLLVAAEKNPVRGNRQGSLLTMWSTQGILFGAVNTVGNLGAVFCDQAYWQGAIAAAGAERGPPAGQRAALRAHLLGGIAWFAIPFATATTLGLCGRALDLPLTGGESANGLVAPAVATHLLGRGGALLVLLQLLAAVTAATASEQVAASSVLAYDVYKRYVNPSAAGRQLVAVSRAGIVAWACASGVPAIVLHELDISLGWACLATGILVGPAVFPAAFALTWRRCSATGAVAGTWLGAGLAVLGWGLCARRLGEVSVSTLGDDLSMLVGNLIALLAAPLIAAAVSLAAPQDFDWAELGRRTGSTTLEDDVRDEDRVSHSVLLGLRDEDLRQPAPAAAAASDSERTQEGPTQAGGAGQPTTAPVLSCWFGGGLLLGLLLIAWLLLALQQDTFSKSYWAWWVAVACVWGHGAAAVTVVYPLYQVQFLNAQAHSMQGVAGSFSRARPLIRIKGP